MSIPSKFLSHLSSFFSQFGAMSFSSCETNSQLIEELQKRSIIKSEEVAQVMKQVDRKKYVKSNPYADSPQTIGFKATISAPHMHAMALEEMKERLVPGSKALDVGSGSGYLTACMGIMVGEKGKVVGIDHIPELVNTSKENILSDHPELLKSGRVQLVVGDGRQGYKETAPYDAIHVGAAFNSTTESEPTELLSQLKPGGVMVIPIGPAFGDQSLYVFKKEKDGRILRKNVASVRFVPLTDKNAQLSSWFSSGKFSFY